MRFTPSDCRQRPTFQLLRQNQRLPKTIMKSFHKLVAVTALSAAASILHAANPVVSGDLKQWHKVTLTLDGPQAKETDTDPNPFTDYNFTVTFTHESGSASHKVPGYFAADGAAANTSADSGN